MQYNELQFAKGIHCCGCTTKQVTAILVTTGAIAVLVGLLIMLRIIFEGEYSEFYGGVMMFWGTIFIVVGLYLPTCVRQARKRH
jgi:hypothetical protein